MRRIFFLILLCLASLGQGQSLRPGQRLKFTCPSEPLLDVSRTITPDGAVILPFLGPVGAAGKSVEKVQATVMDLLKEKGRYLNVSVALTFDPNAPITFRGSSDLSGSVPSTPSKTLSDIILIAHPGSQADLHSIVITDAFGKAFKVDATTSPNVALLAGDDIEIPAGAVTYDAVVLGGVVKPGSVPLHEGLTVAQAIEEAGGLSGHGDAHQITVEHLGQTAPATLETVLFKGDIVRVGLTLDRKFVAVKGGVARQGVVEWHKGMLLSEIIKEAGGEVAGGDISHIEVRRFAGGRIYKFDLAKIRAGGDKDPEIEANDTVIVPLGGRG